nr:hypothetical protein [Tanacetum cinerariifolium]
MPLKPDLVFTDEHVVSESVTSLPDIAKNWVSDSEDENEIETKTKQIKLSFAKVKFVKPIMHVKSPRKSVKQEESRGNPQQELQEKGVIDSGCSRHMTGNMSYFLRRERALRNEFESMIRQDKDANGNRIFTPVNTAGSIYVYFGGSIPINVATLPNADLPTDPLMLDLEDTTDT